MSRRATIAVAGAVLLALVVGAAHLDVPRLAGPIKGDEATYIAMAFSLAKDGDLKYRQEDFVRFKSLYGTGPNGIFLKRHYNLRWEWRAGWPPLRLERVAAPADQELDYGKAFAYAVLAAPFAAVAGLGGLLLMNLLLLALCIWCAVTFCRARLGSVAGTLLGAAFVGASVVPVYGVWMTSEVFNFTLVFVAYFLWLYKKVAPDSANRWLRWPGVDWVAAVLLGVATFSKPPNALLILPLVADALVRRRWRRSAVIAMLFLAGSVGLFAMNGLISGQANYQGGSALDRKYFVTNFPFDGRGTRFDTTGSEMATNSADDENILSPSFVFGHLRYNVPYFFVGRDAGLVPYFFPGALILAWWLFRIRRAPLWQWTTAITCLGSALALLILAPASWNGGGGPIGNRYFLSIYPALLFLVPAGATWFSGSMATAAALVGMTFVGPILVHPFTASQKVWLNPEHWPLRLLPVEMTLINDLPVFLNPQRGRVKVSDNPEVFLYYMDGHTYFQEPTGFWVAPGTADIVVRTEWPLTRLDLGLRSAVANTVRVSIGGRAQQVSLRPSEETRLQFRPAPGVHANGYEVLLEITTSSGFYPKDFDPHATDTRHLGVFIEPTYHVNGP